MPTSSGIPLTDMLQAAEIAIPTDRVTPWPLGGIHSLNTASGLLLNGSTLAALNTRVLLASAHTFLSGEVNSYSGFKVNGQVIQWPKVGTQPYSLSLADNVLFSALSPKTVSLYRKTTGELAIKIGANSGDISAPTNASYLTTRRRGIKFIIVHICAAGGGGGYGSGTFRGWGGGSGATFAAIINVQLFTEANPLIFQVPSGGAGGTSDDGAPGGNFVFSSTAPNCTGSVTVRGGWGGRLGWRSEENGEGKGGEVAYLGNIGTLSPYIHVLADIRGGDGTKPNGGVLSVASYNDPNPVSTPIHTNQSFPAGTNGIGGDGGDKWGNPGTAGHHGGFLIYY